MRPEDTRGQATDPSGKASVNDASTESVPETTPSPETSFEDASAEMSEDERSTQLLTESSQNRPSVARSTLTMSLATLLSRLTGFFRTWAIAFALGNTLLTSAYQIANNVPNMIFELVAGGVLSTAFLPMLMSMRKISDENSRRYANNLLSICLVLLGVVSLLASIFAPQVIATQTFVSGGQEARQMATFFFRFFAFQIIFYGASAIVSGILNSRRRFLWPALGPVFNNVIVIITMFTYVPLSATNPKAAMALLAIGTTVGVVGQCVIQIPALRKSGFHWHFAIDLHDPALVETIKLAIPAIIFTAVNLVCVSFRNAFALGVSGVGPSTLSYAWLWYQFPYGVLAVALSTAMFTEMSESASKGDMEQFRENVRLGLRGTFFLIIPMAVMLFTLAPLLVTLYHAGQFTADDIAMVSRVLRWWAICLPLYAAYLYLYFAFSAIKKLSVVAVTSVIVSCLQIALYATLTTGVGDFGGLGLIGIPIADLVFFTIMYFTLFILLRRRVGVFSKKRILIVTLKTTFASLVGGFIAELFVLFMGSTTSIGMALVEIIIAGTIGLTVTFFICHLMKLEEMDILRKLGRRISGKLKGRHAKQD